jgi:uncharacterized repeat protein (TIGR01451 family)
MRKKCAFRGAPKQMEKTKTTIRIKAAFLLLVMLVQMLQAPIAAAYTFPSLQSVFGTSTLTTDKKRIGIAAILVEDGLMADPANYQGISNIYPNSLKTTTLAERVRRYALDVQKSQPFTRSMIIRVKKDAATEEIAGALEKLYLEGDGTAGETNRLTGIVLIGDVPLPVVNKGGNRFPSIYPYTDFEEKAFIYDAESKDFVPNADAAVTKAEIWHGLITPPVKGSEGNELLAYYFDKNYLFHCKTASCAADSSQFRQFTRKLLFMDLIREFEQMDKQGFGNYLRYVENWENLTYKRWSKYLMKRLYDEADGELKGGDGLDNDGDGKIDEDPKNGVDDDNDGEDGSPLIGMADGFDSDGDQLIDEEDEGRYGLCDLVAGQPAKIKDCTAPGKEPLTDVFYNIKPGSLYKISDGIDNDNDGLIDEGIDEDDGDAFKNIDNDLDGLVDEDTTEDNDADGDTKVDEDGPGDKNGDGCSGECGTDEDLDSYDFDNDGYPNGYEKKYGSFVGTDIPTDPEDPDSIPLNLLGFPFLRLVPLPDANDWIDEEVPADDDEDGKVDEDGTADNDKDGDGQVDEDSGGGSTSADAEAYQNLPDIMTKQMIEQKAAPYNSLFNKYLANINDWVGFTGRWDPSYKIRETDPVTLLEELNDKSDVSTVPALVTMKDEYVRKYLRQVADLVEAKMDSFAQNKSDPNAPQLQEPVAMLRGSKIVGVTVTAENLIDDAEYTGNDFEFVNFARHLYTNWLTFPPIINQETLFINGKAVNEIESTKDCTLYRGSTGIPQNSIMVFASHLYNAFAVPDANPEPNADTPYAGCVSKNAAHPERCYSFAAEKPIFDILGTKEVSAIPESETNYSACFDFKEKTRYDQYLVEVGTYRALTGAMDNEEARKTVPMPGSPYLGSDAIVLADLNGSFDPPAVDVVIRLSDLLAKWGQGDKVDNNGNGIVDEVAEGVADYAIPPNDWKQIGARVLQGRDINNDGFPENIQYVFQGTPYLFPKVKKVILTVVPDIARDENGQKIKISSFSANKEPTNETLDAQGQLGMAPPSLPIDNPRFFTFKDKKGVFRTVKYPNVFALSSIDELRQVLAAKEQELQAIADENGVNLQITDSLTDLIKGEADEYASPTFLIKAGVEDLTDAYKWKNMNIDEKHQYILETYLSPEKNGFVGETPNGYEALYLVAKGDASTLKMNFNGDFPQEDEDPDLASAKQQKDPAPTKPMSGSAGGSGGGGSGQGGEGGEESNPALDAANAMLEGIMIFEWFGEMQKWLDETINNTGFSNAENACSVSDAPGDYFEQLVESGDTDGDGVPDSSDDSPLKPDANGDGMPDGAAGTTKLRLTSDKTVLKTGTSDTMTVTVEALSADNKTQTGDSFTQVELKLASGTGISRNIIRATPVINTSGGVSTGATQGVASEKDELPADINSSNPVSLSKGKASFTLTANDLSGKFTINASSPNRTGIKSNTLTVESTKRKIRLVSYLKTEAIPYSQKELSGFIIKDETDKVIAEVNGDTGMVTIKDDRFELAAYPSYANKPARLAVVQKADGAIVASVFFVADKTQAVLKDGDNTDYFTDYAGLKGVHVKDLNKADRYGFAVMDDTAEFNAGNGYITLKDAQNGSTRNIGIVEADGRIFISKELGFNYRPAISSQSPVVFAVTDKGGTQLFEIYVGVDFPRIEVVREEGAYSDFNLFAALEVAARTVAAIPVFDGIRETLLKTAHAAAVQDTDKDGLNDLEELILGYRYDNSDTDGDGYKDGDELSKNYDPAKPDSPLFSDLTVNSKGFTDIIRIFRRGIVKTYEDMTFRPDVKLTREEFVQLDLGTICINCFSDKLSPQIRTAIDSVYAQSPFPDNDISADLAYCVKEGKNRQIVSGYKGGAMSGYFLPKSLISRAEAAKVVLETARQQKASGIELLSLPSTGKPWYYNYVLSAQKVKLYPRGVFLELDTYGSAEFKQWFDVQLANRGAFVRWLEGDVSRSEFAIMVSKLMDSYDCTLEDSDGDGVPDNYEKYLFSTSATSLDTDQGGVSDFDEITKGSDPNDPSDDKDLVDPDNDGLTNLDEAKYGTNPDEADTDKGGVKDGDEIKNGTDPLDGEDDFSIDSDGDGMPDSWEMQHGLNPYDASDANLDPDGDGLINLDEYKYGTDPNEADTDGGGVNDGDEVMKETNPLAPEDDFGVLEGDEGAYIVGDTVFENYAYAEPDAESKQAGEVLEYSDQMPVDDPGTTEDLNKLFIKASILDENGNTDLTDSVSKINFFATEGGGYAKLLYATVQAVKGEAVTELQSTTAAGIYGASAEIAGKDIPVDGRPIYVVPLEPTQIMLAPKSSVIRSGGLSTTNLHVELRDINNNITNNGAYTVTFNVTGAGSFEAVSDEDTEKEGIQVTTVDGTFDLAVKSAESPGMIGVDAKFEPPSEDDLTTEPEFETASIGVTSEPAPEPVVPAITASATIQSRDDIRISLKPAQTQIPSDYTTVTKIDLRVTDAGGNLIGGYSGKAQFDLMKDTYGDFIGASEKEIVNGRADIVFRASSIAGDAVIGATVQGFDPANTVVTTVPKQAKKIVLEAPDTTIESSPSATIEVTAKLYDSDGNFAYNDSSTQVNFKLTASSAPFAAFAGPAQVTAEYGTASVILRGTDKTGPINLIASATGLKTGTISLNSVKLFHAGSLRALAPNVLFASLLGSDFGNAYKEDYLGGWFIFSGKTQAAVSLITPPKPSARVAEFTNNGQVSMFDPDNYELRVIPANGAVQPNLFVLSDAATKKDLAEMFMVMKPQATAKAATADIDLEKASEGIYVTMINESENYELRPVPDGLSLIRDANERVRFKNDGRVLVFDNRFALTVAEDNTGHYMKLSVNDTGSEVAQVSFVNDFLSDVGELSRNTVIDMTASSYPAGVYIHRLSEQGNIGYEPSFSGNSTALPKGYYVTDKEATLPSSQAPGLSNISLEKSDEEAGIGFVGDNKHMLLFAAGNSVGESNMVYASDAGIVLGDPTVRLNNKIGSPDNYEDYSVGLAENGFTKDIGKEILTGDAPVGELVTIDYNKDGLKDVLVAYEDGKVRLLQNNQSYPRYTDRGIFLNFSGGIVGMAAGDFNGDKIDDLIVATADSCRQGEVCVDLYENRNGNFVRQNLDLEPFTENNRVYMMRAADMNNDGTTDLVTSDDMGTVRVFYNFNGKLDRYGQFVGSLGLHVDNTSNLFKEVLVSHDKIPVNQPGTADDLNFVQFMVPGQGDNILPADREAFDALQGAGTAAATIEATVNAKDRAVDFTYLDLDQGNLGTKSYKQARDMTQPLNVIAKDDLIEYTINLANTKPGAVNLTNVMVSDVIPDSVEFDSANVTCTGCGSEKVNLIETGQSMHPYIFGPFNLAAGKTATIKYTVTAKKTPAVNINVGQNLDSGYPVDNLSDIAASPEGNTSGRMTYFYSTSKDPQSQRILYSTYVTPPPQPQTVQPIPSSQGGIDFNKLNIDADGNGIPDEISNYQTYQKQQEASSVTPSEIVAGIGEVYGALGETLDDIGDGVEAAIEAFTCSSGCIPMPINFGFLAPGMINVLGIPGGFDPGLPVFGWGAPPPAFVWPPMPYQGTTGGRIYLSPTLTMSLAMGICLGPYLAGQCWAFKITDLIPSSVCDEIAGAMNSVVAGANAVAQSIGNDAAVSSDGSATGADSSGRQATGGWSGSTTLGNYQYKASVSTNFRIPGFPAVLTDWLDRQTEEVVNKLTDLPDIYFLYPDPTSIVGMVVPQETGQQTNKNEVKPATELPKPKKWTSFRQVLSYINSIPLVQIESREVLIKIPALTQKEIEKVQNDAKQWLVDTRAEIDRIKEVWSCDKESKYQTICDSLLIDSTDLIKSVEKNIEVLEKYKELPRKILAWRNITAKYVTQIICFLDAVMKFTGGYITKQQQRIEAWIEMIRKVKQTINDWKAIVDLTIDYQASCDKCSTARLTLMELIMKLFAVLPSPPVIPFPKLPDIYIDVSKIQVGLKVLWPDIKFRPEPLIIPKLPRIMLPDIPTVRIVLPAIPVIPAPPDIPLELPDIPMLPFPNLPDIPPPPKVPNFPVSIKVVVSILQKVIRILCLIKKGLIPVSETLLKSHIEQLTERSLTPLIPLDLGFKIQLPPIQYEYLDRIEISTFINFQLDFSGIYDFVQKIADMANAISTDLVKEMNERMKAAAQAAQAAAEAPATLGNEVTGGGQEVNIEASETRLTADTSIRTSEDATTPSEAVNGLSAVSPLLGVAAGELVAASNRLEADAAKYQAIAESYEDIKLEVKQDMLALSDPILNRPLAEIKAGRASDYPAEFEIQKKMTAMRDSLIAYNDDQDTVMNELLSASDGEEYARILAGMPTIDAYIGDAGYGATDRAIASITPAAESRPEKTATTVKLEGSLLEDFAAGVLAGLTEKKRLIADISMPDVPSTPGTTGSTPSYVGIYVYNAATGSNERLMNYTDEADQPSKLMFIDMDNDGDNDIMYSYGGNIYLKENYKLYPAAEYNSYVGDPPQTVDLDAYIPALPAINGFSSNYNNNRSVEMMWTPSQDPDVSGYEISYRLVPDAFTQKLNSKDHRVTAVIQSPLSETPIPEDATFKPERLEKDYMTAENVNGDVYFDGTKRIFLVANATPVDTVPGQVIHTLAQSTMSFTSAGSAAGELTLPANAAFTVSSSFTSGLTVSVNNGAVEIIDPEKTETRQKLVNGMRVDYDTTLISENGGSAMVRMGDGSYARLDPNGELTLKLLESAASPSVKFVIPNGFYYARINAFKKTADGSGRFTGTSSTITLMAPSLCADKQGPLPNAGPAERTVSIFKELEIDAVKSFDANGEIIAYWMDTDLAKDNNMDGDAGNDKDLGNDLDITKDFDGDGKANNDLDDPVFKLGPYNDLNERKVKLNVMDEAGNVSGQEITIRIFVPEVTIADSTAESGVIRGSIAPVDKDIPVSVLRNRDGLISKIKTASANPYGKYLTDIAGEFEVGDLNLKDTIIIKNSEGEAIGEINAQTGRIVLYDDSYSLEVLPAELPLLPTRIVVKDKDGNIITTLFLVPDMNTDATIDAPNLPYDEATIAVFKGVHLKDIDPLDDFEFGKLPADDPNYPGGVEIIEKTSGKRAAIIDTGGNFYVIDQRLSLRLKSAKTLDDPLVMEIMFTPEGGTARVIGEFFIAVNSGKDLQIVSADKFKVFVEGTKARGPLYDSDGDGLPDAWELTFGLNPNDPSDAALDGDNDGLTNLEEYQAGTNPLNPDSDGDGYTDGQEIVFGQDPSKKAESPFADVSPDHPYFRSIINLNQRNVLKGVPQGDKMMFMPDSPITRAEFSRIMLEIFCIIPRKEAYEGPASFSDIPYTPAKLPWYYAVTKEAYFQGFITGYLGEIDKTTGITPFKPENTITRAEAVKVILESLERFGAIGMGKVPVTEPWYKTYIEIARDLKPYLQQNQYLSKAFILTADEAAQPEKAMTRAEFVAMADRVLMAYDCSTIDTDGDGMPDYWEKKYGLNYLDPSDADLDPDGDGLSNLEEYRHGTDPRNPDTDMGGVSDGDEVKKGTNPRNDSLDDPIDKDGDGLTDRAETSVFGTDPNAADTDKGGVNDGDEVMVNNTDPLNPSDDGDIDGDGLSDYDEKNTYGTDPYNPDTDGGGVRDGDEVYRGTDPLDPEDDLIDPRSDLEEGIYMIQEECNACPCPAAIEHTADLIPGDIVFGVISNNDESEIFSRSNEVRITAVPKAE